MSTRLTTFVDAFNSSHDVKFECAEEAYHDTVFYTVKPIGWLMMTSTPSWDEMIQYCITTFGPSEGIWVKGERWYVNSARFYFRDSRDRTAFLLRFA
jgi:hypothetical protein